MSFHETTTEIFSFESPSLWPFRESNRGLMMRRYDNKAIGLLLLQ